MFTNKYFQFLIIISFCYFTCCKSYNKKNNEVENTSVTLTSTASKIDSPNFTFPFLDSIANRDTLTITQMKLHTIIDSDYFVLPNCVFNGDTIITKKPQYELAIIDFNDRLVCLDKLLFIFNTKTGVNTDFKLIETDCDEDESSTNFEYSYNLINHSILKTIETITEPAIHNKNKTTTITRKWRINQLGKLVIIDSTSSVSYPTSMD